MSDIPSMGQAKWVSDYVQKLERELNLAHFRIQMLLEAGDAIAEYDLVPDQLAERWNKAKEAKP